MIAVPFQRRDTSSTWEKQKKLEGKQNGLATKITGYYSAHTDNCLNSADNIRHYWKLQILLHGGNTVQHQTHAKKTRAKNSPHFSSKAFCYLQPSLLCSCVLARLEHAHGKILAGKYPWLLQRDAGTRLGQLATLPVDLRGTRHRGDVWPCCDSTGCDSTAMNCCEAPCTFTGSSQDADMTVHDSLYWTRHMMEKALHRGESVRVLCRAW